jgi:hypothetical protein
VSLENSLHLHTPQIVRTHTAARQQSQTNHMRCDAACCAQAHANPSPVARNCILQQLTGRPLNEARLKEPPRKASEPKHHPEHIVAQHLMFCWHSTHAHQLAAGAAPMLTAMAAAPRCAVR